MHQFGGEIVRAAVGSGEQFDDIESDDCLFTDDAAQEAGIEVPQQTGPDMERVLREFEPLLQSIAAAASDESSRGKIEPLLVRLEENGWMLSDAAHRIWAGERDAAALTEGIDGNSAQLVRRVLELLEE